MSDIEWGPPPPAPVGSQKGGGHVQRFVGALKARPGEWAKSAVPVKFGHAIVHHRTKVFPGTEWTSRKRDDGEYDIYGRWIGES